MHKKILTPIHPILNIPHKKDKSVSRSSTKPKRTIPCKRCGLDCSGSKGMQNKDGTKYPICDECRKDYD